MSWDEFLRHVDPKREIQIEALPRSAATNVVAIEPGRAVDDTRAAASVLAPLPRGWRLGMPRMLASLRTAHRWAIAAAVPLIVALSIGYAISNRSRARD